MLYTYRIQQNILIKKPWKPCIYMLYTYRIQPNVCNMLLSNMAVVHEWRKTLMLRPYSRPEYLEFINSFSTNHSNSISPHIPLFVNTSFKNRYSSFPVSNETGEYGVGDAGVFASEVFYFAAVTEYLCGDVRFVHSDW